MTLGKKIKYLREEKHLSQQQLAEMLEIDRSTITGYETGKRNPDIYTAKRIAKFFDVTLDFLLDDTSNSL